MSNQVKIEDEVKKMVVEYVEKVGWKKALHESLYVFEKLGTTPHFHIEIRAGHWLPTARFRLMVLEYLFGDEDTMEKELLIAAKKYLNVSKRSTDTSIGHTRPRRTT